MSAGQGSGEILKNARVAAEKTLEQMSAETQINIRYLGEIEAGGNFSLPEIYRKTFIRTYAKALGLDPEEIFGGEEAEAAEALSRVDPVSEGPVAGPPVEPPLASPVFSGTLSDNAQRRTMVIVVIFLLTALILAVKWLGSDDGGGGGTPPVAASPRQTSAPRPGEGLSAFNQDKDTRGSEPAGGPAPDSLVLVATSSESVWVHIVLDNDSAIEYTMPPKYSVTLRAAENFLLAVGNPAGLSITLNGRHLDILGGGNRPKKNILLSRKTLSQ